MVNLNVIGVSFSYDSHEVLKDLSFSANNGEIVGIIGENGSGKTTLLNCINSVYGAFRGSVLINGMSEDLEKWHKTVDVRDLTDYDRSRIIATVEQNSNQTFPFTVIETVRMGRYSRTGVMDESDDEEMDLLCGVMEETGVLEFSNRNVTDLSGGEWRRVMIAQALAQEPEILLLDEPTLHLDICHQFDLMELCKRIVKERGILVIIVTHDLQIATRYCDKIIVMKHGRIVSMGKTEETITESVIRDVFHMKSKIESVGDGGVLVHLLSRVR